MANKLIAILIMKTTFAEASIRRVSLELNSKPPSRSSNLTHSRVSMCYSANLKKRTDALNAQKTIFDELYPQSEVGIEEVKNIQKKQALHPKIKKQPKPLAITKININEKKNHSQPFEISAKNVRLKDKDKRPHTCKKIEEQIIPNYDTIKTLYVQQRQESNSIDVDFKEGKKMKASKNCPQNKKEEEQKIRYMKTANARVLTAPSNCNLLFNSKASKFQQKETYKTNQINFSQHFKNLQEGSSVFPTCRRMAISSVNKFYQLCIEDIRDLQQKKKKAKQERQQKQRQQKLQDCAEDSMKKNNSVSISKIKGENIQASNKNIAKNVESYKLIKPPPKSSMQGNKIEADESNVWLEIRNTIQDQQHLGYTLCSKKQILERSTLTAPFKKNIASRKLLKKCATDAHRYEDEQCIYSSPTRMSRTKSMKSQKNNLRQGFHHFNEDGPLDAWDTLQQNFESNQNEFNL